MLPRPRVDWMTDADDRILETLYEIAPLPANPVMLAFATDYDQSYVGRRCQELAAEGLIERVSDGTLYRITDLGNRYITGDADREDLEREE